MQSLDGTPFKRQNIKQDRLRHLRSGAQLLLAGAASLMAGASFQLTNSLITSLHSEPRYSTHVSTSTMPTYNSRRVMHFRLADAQASITHTTHLHVRRQRGLLSIRKREPLSLCHRSSLQQLLQAAAAAVHAERHAGVAAGQLPVDSAGKARGRLFWLYPVRAETEAVGL